MKHRFSVLLTVLILSSQINGQTRIDSLKASLENAIGGDRLEILNSLSAELLTSSPDESRKYIESARQESRENSRERILADYHLGFYFKEIADFDSAYIYYQQALSAAEKNNFRSILPKIHNGLGTVWYKRSDFDKALEHYQSAVDIAIEIGDEIANTSRLLNIGRIYFYQGDLNRALEYFQQATDNSEIYRDKFGSANALKEIGKIYNQWQQYPAAKRYYHNALEIYRDIGDEKQISIILNELGIISRNEKDYQAAIEYQQKSLEIKEKIGYKYGIASSLNGLGITYKSMQHYEKALEYYRKALEIQLEINDEMGAAATISNIGNIQLHLGDPDSALGSFNTSIEIAGKIQYNQLIINNLIAVSDIYSDKNEFAKSLNYLKQAIAIKDSIFSREKHRQFAEMQTRYETIKKDKENAQLKYELNLNQLKISQQETQRNLLIIIIFITLISSGLIFGLYRLRTKAYLALSKANRMILQQKGELEQMNKTRDRFFSIISHDLRNSLGSAQMGIELLQNSEELGKDELAMVMTELKSSITNLTNLLENLLEWARLQIGRIHAEPTDMNLAEILENVLITLKSKLTQKQIELISEISENSIVYADRNMLYSILQNLLGNAVKFSATGAKIKISEKNGDKNIEISISDEGVGIDSDRLSRLFRVDEIVSTPGTNAEKGTGLGLILCREFIEKNGGRIRVESKPGAGTTVRFTLPRSTKA